MACSSLAPTPSATRIDDSTADVFSTYLTPRRPEDSTNLALDRSNSALDHRHRVTFETIYDLPFFKHGNSWFMKNIVGNWEFAPIYTYQTGTWVDVQSGVDSNLNADSAGDRAFVNPAGTANVGSGVTALKNSAGETVAYARSIIKKCVKVVGKARLEPGVIVFTVVNAFDKRSLATKNAIALKALMNCLTRARFSVYRAARI